MRSALWVLLLAIVAAPFDAEAAPGIGERLPRADGAATSAFARLPLHFEPNHGQADGDVRFLARAAGYSVLLSAPEARLVLLEPRGLPAVARSRSEGPPPRRTSVLRMRLIGANPSPTVVGLEERPGRTNYFIGQDPARWRTNVPTYGKVRYEGVYPGVDLVFYGTSRQLEYDLVIAPGVDPEAITLGFDGCDEVRVDADGDLILRTPIGDVRQRKPVVYQVAGAGKEPVEARYVLTGSREVGVRVGAYDRSRELVIDPLLIFSTYLGDTRHEEANGIAVDDAGNAYVTGESIEALNEYDFPIRSSMFVAKLSDDGSTLLYQTFIGPSAQGRFLGRGIAVDPARNAYVVGRASVLGEVGGAFVWKLDPSGVLVYSALVGGEEGTGIAVDLGGRAHMTGWVPAAYSLSTTPNAFRRTPSRDGYDVFVVKLSADGSTALYASYLGSCRCGPFEQPKIALDATGNMYVAGGTAAEDFPVTPGAFQMAFGRGTTESTDPVDAVDAFVAKIDPSRSGSASLIYSTFLGGGHRDEARGIAVDTSGSAYVTGVTTSSNFPLVKPLQPRLPPGFTAAFVAKLSPDGSQLLYSTYLGNGLGDFVAPRGIAVDAAGQAYVTGYAGPYFPTTVATGAVQPDFAGGVTDMFLSVFDATGSVLRHSTYLGGSGFDWANAVAVDAAGSAYIAGRTGGGPLYDYGPSDDFPTSPWAVQPSFGGGLTDAIVAKISNPTAGTGLQFVTFPEVFPSLPPTGQVGAPYTGNIGIGGGRPPYTIQIVAGALPPGLRFNSPVITGTPSEMLAALFTAQVRDALNAIVEKTFQITIQALPVLQVTVPPAPFGSVRIGQSAELTFMVTNLGVTDLTGTVAEAAPPFSVVSGAGSFTLAQNASRPVVVRFTPPAAGPARAELRVSSNGGETIATLRGTGVPPVELTVVKAGAGEGTVRSAPVGIECGAACAATFLPDTVVTLTAEARTEPGRVSRFRDWSGCDQSGGATCTVTLAASATVTATFDRVLPDLVATSVTLSTSTVRAGGAVSGSVVVSNEGPEAAGPFLMTYHVARDAAAYRRDPLATRSRWVPGLEPGASVTVPLRVILPRAAPGGTYEVVACADGDHAIDDAEESNNCRIASTSLEVPAPGLVVDQVTPRAGSVRAGAALRVTTVVRNQGGSRAGASMVTYFVSATGMRDGSETPLHGMLRIGSLYSGTQAEAIARVVVPRTLPAGLYFVVACADGTRRMSKTGETNNCRASAVTVQVNGR